MTVISTLTITITMTTMMIVMTTISIHITKILILTTTTMMMMMMFISWITYASTRLDEALMILTKQWYLDPKDKQDQQVIAKAKADAELCFDSIEHVLKDRQYILGPE